jgi:hypothetical protein
MRGWHLRELRGLDGYYLVEPGDVAALAGAIRGVRSASDLVANGTL